MPELIRIEMKIGVFGGSFDPVHTGHAMVASYALQFCGLDEVWLMVSRRNPLKTDATAASDQDRLAMARIVADSVTGLRVSDLEMQLPEPSFTYRTLCELRRLHPHNQFKLIIGADNWNDFLRWRDPEKIIREFGLLVFPRPGYNLNDNLPDGVEIASGSPQAFISSTFIRGALREGKNLNFFLPSGVMEYIERRRLYGIGNDAEAASRNNFFKDESGRKSQKTD